MAIPSNITFNTDKLKVREWRVLGAVRLDPEKAVEFLKNRTSLTESDIDELTLDELGAVMKALNEAIQEAAVPKVN